MVLQYTHRARSCSFVGPEYGTGITVASNPAAVYISLKKRNRQGKSCTTPLLRHTLLPLSRRIIQHITTIQRTTTLPLTTTTG